MASVIIHLAVTANVLDACKIDTHRDEYFFGTVLPDYNLKEDHHYRENRNGIKIFDTARFRREFADKLDDPVYLGYYLHLVQDMVFRHFMYNVHGFSSAERSNVLGLYSDYQRLNSVLARKYRIPVEILKNTDRISADRYPEFPLNRAELEEETEKYHNVNIRPEGDYFFFTPKMAEEYILLATDACINELKAFRGEAEHIDGAAFFLNGKRKE